ncbi:MAG: holo-ACP synthase [Clostridia bacterium]|nr:holo-ACP synthase [Clostridia bacterium]
MKVGIDMVEVSRFFDKCENVAFLSRVFTKKEREHIEQLSNQQARAERIAGKFAGKEAVVKMLGTGIDKGVKWTEIEILPNELGKPVVSFSGVTKEIAQSLKIKEMDISISHTHDNAVAICIAK